MNFETIDMECANDDEEAPACDPCEDQVVPDDNDVAVLADDADACEAIAGAVLHAVEEVGRVAAPRRSQKRSSGQQVLKAPHLQERALHASVAVTTQSRGRQSGSGERARNRQRCRSLCNRCPLF